ncbi:hypothetical protein [Aeromonas caviae]
MKRYDLELTATGPVMEERQEGAFVPFSEVSGLAEQLADATRQCGVMAELLRELREGAEIHLHNCNVCKNEEGVNNWTGKLARIDAALDGKFPLPAWYLDGAKDFKSMMLEASTAIFHPHIEGVFAVFERQLALDAPQGGESCALEPRSSSPA